MRNTTRLMSAGAAIAATLAFTASANAATTSGTATAEILSSLSVAQTRGLDFAQIAVNTAGDVTIGVGGTPVNTCDPTLVCAGSQTSARFQVTGAPGVGVTASVQEASITLDNGAGGTMTVDGFDIYFPNGTTLNASGNRSFDVGATLHVSTGQAQGVYNGTYTVEVLYN